jgi:hypothetical protein
MAERRVKAVVEVRVRIAVDSVWSLDTTVEQVRKQSIDDARGQLAQILQDTEGKVVVNRDGEPWVVDMFISEK